MGRAIKIGEHIAQAQYMSLVVTEHLLMKRPNDGIEKPISEPDIEPPECIFFSLQLSRVASTCFFVSMLICKVANYLRYAQRHELQSGVIAPATARLLHRIAMSRQLFNIVHQTIQLPLAIHFGFSAQGKTI